MKKLTEVLLAISTVCLTAAILVVALVHQPELPISQSKAARRQCELARMDAAMLVDLAFSPSELDRDSTRYWVHDYVVFTQRQCALFTVPAMFHCNTDGCRAAELASMNMVMP